MRFLILFLFPVAAVADVTFLWTAPAPVTGIQYDAVRIYCQQGAGPVTQLAEVPATATTHIEPVMADGFYTCHMTSMGTRLTDGAQVESDPSAAVSAIVSNVTVVIPVPLAPSAITVR